MTEINEGFDQLEKELIEKARGLPEYQVLLDTFRKKMNGAVPNEIQTIFLARQASEDHAVNSGRISRAELDQFKREFYAPVTT